MNALLAPHRRIGLELLWQAIAGFVDVTAIMLAAILLARRYQRGALSQPMQNSPIAATRD